MTATMFLEQQAERGRARLRGPIGRPSALVTRRHSADPTLSLAPRLRGRDPLPHARTPPATPKPHHGDARARAAALAAADA